MITFWDLVLCNQTKQQKAHLSVLVAQLVGSVSWWPSWLDHSHAVLDCMVGNRTFKSSCCY